MTQGDVSEALERPPERLPEASELDRLWSELTGSQVRPDHRLDPEFYATFYPDISQAGLTPEEHYWKHGVQEGRVANGYGRARMEGGKQIDEALRALTTHPDLCAAMDTGVPGAAELAYELIRLGHPIDARVSNFSVQHYLEIYPDIARAGIDPLRHYLSKGRAEGRRTLEDLRQGVMEGAREFDPSRPTCLVISHEFSKSGAPIVARDIAREASRTHNVVVMALRTGALVEEFRAEACRVIVSEQPFEDWAYFGAPELEAVDFAILNSVETFFFVKPLVAQAIPFVAYVHEFAEYILPPYKAAYMALYADRIVFSSEAVRRSWAGLLKDVGFDATRHASLMAQASLDFVPMPRRRCMDARARLSSVLGVDVGRCRIVYGAGHMQIRKGTDLFVLTAQQMRAIDPDTIFVWIGDGANHEDVFFGVWLDKHMREATSGDPAGNLFMIPAGPHYSDVCAAADILFLPSRLDPLPNVVFDAARLGCTTVLFTGATGFDDAVYDDMASLIRVPYGDMAAACQAILKAPRKLPLRATPPKRAKEIEIAQVPMFQTIQSLIATALQDAPEEDAERPAPAHDVSVLFREEPELRHRERAVLARLHRHAIWTDVEAARRDLAEEGGWMHARSRIAPQADLDPGDPVLTDIRPSIHVHAHYLDGLEDDLNGLAAYRMAERIVVTTSSDELAERIARMGDAAGLSSLEARVVPNQGRDILPFLHVVAGEDAGPDETVWAHVHQKKSITSTSGGDVWRAFLMRIVMGDAAHVSSALARIAAPGTGLVTAFDPYVVGWAGSRRLLPDIERRLGRSLPPHPLLFPVGNMFWTRAGIARRMLALFGEAYPWPNEPLPNDGTVYHLIERLWPAIAADCETDTVFLDRPDTKRI